MAESTQTDSLWGQTFEIAVKRGALLALFEARLSSPDEPGLDDWRRLAAADVYAALASALSESDPNQKASTRETARHLFVMGLGLGQTAVREYLRRLPADVSRYVVRALWCPLQMPQSEHDFEQESQRLLRAFCSTFAFAGTPDPASLGRGYPVWADFLLWLEPIDAGIDRQVLCLEISLNGLPEAVDFRVPAAHLEELSRHAWYLESRSVFSRVCAEVSGESFHFSPRMTHHLPNFTSRDKPLYKLCQAASYLCTMIRWLQSKQITDRAVRVRAISITQNGIESLGATFFGAPDPRQDLLASLGRAYRDTEKVPDADDQALIDHVRFAFDRICKALPQVLSRSLMALRGPPQPGVGLAFNCNEELTDFFNPMQPLDWRQALMGLRSDARLIRFLGREPQEAIAAVLHSGNDSTREVPLRDLHSAAVAAGIRAARPGELTVLGLEGNPGIGKTTAVANSLRAEEEGFLLLYVSPRIIINDDVVGKLARDERGRASGTLCLTTNSKLIASARPWSAAREGGSAGRQGPDGGPQAWVDGAVIVDGLATFRRPSSSILFLDPADKEDIEATQSGSSFRKRPETERQDRIEDRHSIGVLKTLALATRLALHENPSVNKVVLSAAMQGYRESTGERSTLLALSKLFENSVTVAAGLAERCRFARRIPTVVVMIDELTGDGAGAPFVHSIARWLRQEFLEPFEQEDHPPFRIILIISDASLGNEIVLDRYLNSGVSAPDKVLITPSRGPEAFRLAIHDVRIGGRRVPVYHVMTNSYPASTLRISYRIRLDVIRPEILPDGRSQTLRQAIKLQQGDAVISNAVEAIEAAMKAGAEQVIFFAQDKGFLRDLRNELTSAQTRMSPLEYSQVEILDSDVSAARRKELIEESRRDGIKVFLITSSAARGVSFPKSDWIIALAPRFAIEASLMEMAQLIYRGRGDRYLADDGEPKTGGDWKARQLVMLVQDFLPEESNPEPRYWLRRASDLLTYLVMLRATIHTRISGDAGLSRHPLALIPVGKVGSQEQISLMSSHVELFLREVDVVVRETALSKDTRAMLMDASRNAHHLFSKFSLDASATHSSHRSMARPSDVEMLCTHAGADNAPLLLDPGQCPQAILPESVFCIGPYWLERVVDATLQERFNIEGWLAEVGQDTRRLIAQLRRIEHTRSFSGKLRRSAGELYRILRRRYPTEGAREFSTVKALESRNVWIAIPVDFPRFWQRGSDGSFPTLNGDDDLWRAALAVALNGTHNVLPIIPVYAEFPYAVVVGSQDPGGIERIFDDRYFPATHELNLLNSLLIAEGGS